MVSVKAPEVPNSEQSADPHQLIEMASAYVIKGALVSPSPTAGGDRDPISPHGGSWAHRISWRDAECRASSSGCWACWDSCREGLRRIHGAVLLDSTKSRAGV